MFFKLIFLIKYLKKKEKKYINEEVRMNRVVV